MNEQYKQFYNTYAPHIQLTDSDVADITWQYGDDMLRFVTDFESAFLKPDGKKFSDELYNNIKEYKPTAVETPPKTPYIPLKEQGIHDFMDAEQRKLKGKPPWLKEQSNSTRLQNLNEKYGALDFKFEHDVIGGYSPFEAYNLFPSPFKVTSPDGKHNMTINPNDEDAENQLTSFIDKHLSLIHI